MPRRVGRCAVAAAVLLVGSVLAPVSASAAAPTITSFTPTSGTIGTQVTVTGSGLHTAEDVRFDGVPASAFHVVSDTKLTAKVGPGTASGPIEIVTKDGTATSTESFTVQAGLWFSAASVPPGGTVVLYGVGFVADEQIDISFDHKQLGVTKADQNGAFGPYRVKVPGTIRPGTHELEALGVVSGISTTRPIIVFSTWPQQGANAAHTGYNTSERILGTGNVHNLQEAWHAPGSGSAVVAYSAALTGATGVVYVDDAETGDLDAYPAQCRTDGGSCDPLWTASTGGFSQYVSPAVGNGDVYVGSTDGTLYAYPANCRSDGGVCTPVWHANLGGRISASPTIADGIVYVDTVIGTSSDFNWYSVLAAYPAACGTGNATCTPLWYHSDFHGFLFVTSPTVANGVVYQTANVWAPDRGGPVYAFTNCGTDGGQCGPSWTYSEAANQNYGFTSAPDVHAGEMFVSSTVTGEVYAFPATCSDCEILWDGEAIGDTFTGTPADADGWVYGSGGGIVEAYDQQCAEDGSICDPIWVAPISAGDDSPQIGAPAVAHGVVYVSAPDGHVYAFGAHCGSDESSCSPLWQTFAGHEIARPPVIANGWLYVTSETGLHAYTLPG